MTSPEQEEYHRGVSNGSGGGRRSPMGRVDKGHRSTHPTAGTATRVSSSPLPPGTCTCHVQLGVVMHLLRQGLDTLAVLSICSRSGLSLDHVVVYPSW